MSIYDRGDLKRAGFTDEVIDRHFAHNPAWEGWVPRDQFAHDMLLTRDVEPISWNTPLPNPRGERETERPRFWRNRFNQETPVDDRYTLTARGLKHVTTPDNEDEMQQLPTPEELMALVKAVERPAMLPAQVDSAIRSRRVLELVQRLTGAMEVSNVPTHLKATARELTQLLAGDGAYHREMQPKSAEVVNDPELHAKAMAEAMAKENALARPPSTDPAHYDAKAVREFTERATGQLEAIELAYQDGFAMGQRNMAEQLSKLTLAQLVKANVRKNLGAPASLVDDSGVDSSQEEENPAEERERGESIDYQELVDREDLTFRGIHLEPPK